MNSRPFVVLIIFLISLLISSCFGTKTISFDNKAIHKKDNVLVYQSDEVYQLINFNFGTTTLTGDLWEATFSDLTNLQKTKYLEVYLDPGYSLPAIYNNNRYVEIPNDSIVKIERTRFRAELGLLAIPIYYIVGISIYFLGSL